MARSEAHDSGVAKHRRQTEIPERAVRFDAPVRPAWELTEDELAQVVGGVATPKLM